MVKTILPLLLATSAMGMPMGDELAAPKPAKPDFNPAEHIRKWLRDGKIIAVNSLDDDSMPVSSLEFSFSSDRQCDGFQFENKGNPIILLSKSGLTYKNWVNHDGDVTLTADKFGHGRVLLYGSLRDLDLSAGDNTEEALQRCFVAAHPEAEGIFDGEGAEDLVWLEFDVDHLNCAGTVNGVMTRILIVRTSMGTSILVLRTPMMRMRSITVNTMERSIMARNTMEEAPRQETSRRPPW